MGTSVKYATSLFHLILLLLLSVSAAPALGQAQSHAIEAQPKERASLSEAALPGVSELEDGWNTLHPGGETTCAHGDDFHFYARGADPARLMVYLHAGGVCSDAETCDPERDTSTYASTVEPKRDPSGMGGIFDLEHPDNPIAGYSMVAVPVCTGDARLGDRDVTYTLEKSGETRQFTIHHRGQTNTMAAIDWIRSNFESPREIFVAGKSDGAVGMPFYASLLAQHYPSARVFGLGDDAGSWGTAATAAVDPGQWGVPDVLRRHPGWKEFHGSLGVEHLYITAARSAPDLRLYQLDHAHDATQRLYLQLAKAEDLDVLRHLRDNRRIISEQVPEFRSFTVGGFQHTVLNQDRFYHYQSNGHRLRDWVAAIVADEPVASVDCTDDCLRPGLVYGEDDLRVIERAIELLSSPGAWNPQDAPSACPAQADSYSIRCAVLRAELEVTGRSPDGSGNLPPALWDVIYTATERLGDRRLNNPLLRFNNHPDTAAADMIEVLEEVRNRIRASLSTNR